MEPRTRQQCNAQRRHGPGYGSIVTRSAKATKTVTHPYNHPTTTTTAMGAATAILMVFIGCCSNVVFLEFLVKEEPACGNLITFAQFLFIAFEGFVFTMNFGKRKNVIPLK
ncbi:UDP-xylose and UDP-N-acetylglucosamine transporter [Chionoecetes opilio]|uniref:UDP-xylose and UDP-N-acetylglucosamine transporter n=1 Tax=Chionoecetes opilio TaxID=41210 RepID=A0A8J4YJC6_CHIOP|nr:UDP-xylose and UDP-N-acetylglucosamine transporter [Chionoecetes opilio]